MGDLDGAKFLVTGVSRPGGIGATLTRRLAVRGAIVAIHGSVAYDQEQGYADAGSQSAEQLDIDLLNDGLRVVRLASSDLALVGAADAVVAEAIAAVGPLTDLVVNHAYSVCQEFGTWTEADIDSHLSVNVRSTMMFAQSFAAQFPADRDGAITLMASGQYLGPMISEVA